MADKTYHIHGDNIVECNRTLSYIDSALKAAVVERRGPFGSVTCPHYEYTLTSKEKLQFIFLPGFGSKRWNKDIIQYIRDSGGKLREAPDSIVTEVKDGEEKSLFALEFCGALPAGNQAWQRHGRAFSLSHASIPYFFITEVGGFELGSDRNQKAERFPNPAAPFSFYTTTTQRGSPCLPVYEPNSGTSDSTKASYKAVFGKVDLIDYIKAALTDAPVEGSINSLKAKTLELVQVLTKGKKRLDGLTADQWVKVKETVDSGKSITSFLSANAPLPWKKKASIAALTPSAKKFMELGAKYGLGLTSSSLPLSFIPMDKRSVFAKETKKLYPNISIEAEQWLASSNKDLAIAWVMGFKPRGDDARPDRGLAALARMLVGDSTDVITFVYGPVNQTHWGDFKNQPARLVRNGLWEAILGTSDAVLVDSRTMKKDTPRCVLKNSWASILQKTTTSIYVKPSVLSLGEQDVDTALHTLFSSLGSDIAFEGMCNPPGGDWSGVSFVWSRKGVEHRWLTLPRVSATGAKRPDHIFAVFDDQDEVYCLCIESKEQPQSLEKDIGPRLIRYVKTLFSNTPNISRSSSQEEWTPFKDKWLLKTATFVSVGAYLHLDDGAISKVVPETKLDLLCGVEFKDNNAVVAHFKSNTALGAKVLDYLMEKFTAEDLFSLLKA